jgi:hypothetical protein
LATADEYIQRLRLLCDRPDWRLLEPTEEFYSKLLTGEDSDLLAAARAVTDHIGIPPLGSVSYEWGLVMPASIAGRIHLGFSADSKIQIPLSYVGKPLPLGAILAHELSHQMLASQGIWCAEEQENEELTDAASIVAGLGKLVLNGTISTLTEEAEEAQLLGYLPLRTRAELYKKINVYHGVPDNVAMEYLTQFALNLLVESTA